MRYLVLLNLISAAASVHAALTFTGPYSQEFDGLAASSPHSIPAPAGWSFQDGGGNGDGAYGTSNGTLSVGDVYSYGDTAGDRAFGSLRGAPVTSTNPLRFGVTFQNLTGNTIDTLAVSYRGEQWRVGEANGTPDRLDFQFKRSAAESSVEIGDSSYLDFDVLDFQSPFVTGNTALDDSPLDGNAVANRSLVSAVITDLNVAPDEFFTLRWNDVNKSGADDGLAIDGLSIAVVPEPSTYLAGAFAVGVLLLAGRRSRGTRGSSPPDTRSGKAANGK